MNITRVTSPNGYLPLVDYILETFKPCMKLQDLDSKQRVQWFSNVFLVIKMLEDVGRCLVLLRSLSIIQAQNITVSF